MDKGQLTIKVEPVQQAALQILCHSEPVLRLVWESPSSSRPLSSFDGDCHTSDIGHWFAMTREVGCGNLHGLPGKRSSYPVGALIERPAGICSVFA